MRDALESFLRQEQGAGRLRGDARPRRLADFAVAAVQGGLLLGLLDRAPEAPQGAIDVALAHLQRYRSAPRRSPRCRLSDARSAPGAMGAR